MAAKVVAPSIATTATAPDASGSHAGHGGYGAEITVEGIGALQRTLGKFAPDLRRRLYAEMGHEVKTIAGVAIGLTPNVTGATRAGIKVTRGKSRGGFYGFRIVQASRSGAIMEFAGSASRGKTTQGTSLIATLDRMYGKPGRFIWQAWDQNSEGFARTMQRIIDDAVRDLNRLNEGQGVTQQRPAPKPRKNKIDAPKPKGA